MADPHDVSTTKMVRRDFGRSGLDITYADIRVLHGVVYIRGTVSVNKSTDVEDPKAEMERVARLLRQRAGIKDVVVDVRYRT